MSSYSSGSHTVDGRLISGATPADGDVLTWVTADRCWEPRPASSIMPAVVNQDYYIDGVTGSDANTGLTKTVPLATIQGFFTKYGYEVPIGSQRRVHLAGIGGADPWETPTTQQVYGADEINLGTNGPVGNRTVFRGPTNEILGIPATGPATAALDALPGGCQICLETDVANPAGQRTRLNFVGAAPGWTANDFSVYGQGYKLRITRAGAKVIFECPIADNGANFIIVDTLGLVGVVLATDTFEIVYPAAAIRGATDLGGGARLVHIIGEGSEIIGLAALTAASMGHSFERLVFEDTVVDGKFVSFDRCCFIPGIFGIGVRIAGGAHFKNSMSVQVSVAVNNGGRVYPQPIAAANIPRPDAVANPINQAICILGSFCGIKCGENTAASSGYFAADDNVSCYGSTTDGINCVAGSIFVQDATCLYLGGNANVGWGISVNDGSHAIVLGGDVTLGGTATEITGTSGDLQVDDDAGGAPYGIGAGEFAQVAGYNGLYHNTSLAAGVTTGRMSYIRR